ncbi:hypothetical protein DK26_23295 [Bosea sp. WAO]|uniref:hypothetical protein n=1 Tax=Bosea sp. WAO TaxID=406341 RepID=UPI0007463E14|nr:hypothetical protein [Bosea sp. WAO]KUL93449.1 hypothetical protein DK26_23295 [Bosea sp. WAO]
MGDVTRIYITSSPSWATWVRRLVTGATLLMGPIAIGIVCDSAAMQWLGFIAGMVAICAVAKRTADHTTFETTDQARAYLDALDAGKRP